MQLTHSGYYAAVPAEGEIEPGGSTKVRIILTKNALVSAEHKVIIASAPKSSKRRTCVNQTLAVQLDPQVEDAANQAYSKQQLELFICNAVNRGQSLSAAEKELFADPSIVPRAVKQFVAKQYQECLIEALKCNYRDAVRTMVQQGMSSSVHGW